MTTPIPAPPGLPILGHATMIDKDLALNSFRNWAKQYGEIYRLNVLSESARLPFAYASYLTCRCR